MAIYLTMPRRLKAASNSKVAHGSSSHRTPVGWWRRWRPPWTIRWDAGGYKLNFDLNCAVGLWIWPLILIIAFTSFSLNLYKEVFHPVLSLVSKTTPGPSALVSLAPLGVRIEPTLDIGQTIALARAEAQRRGWSTPPGGIFYNERGGFYNVSFFDHATHDDSDGMGLSNLYIDGEDGRLIGCNQP